jgi:S-adenosylmethionine decarboxylase
MDTFGHHLLVEYRGCDVGVLDDVTRLEALLRHAASEAGATVLDARFHRFRPQGVSGVLLVEESHLSIHTWPEAAYAAVDFYTCGLCAPGRAADALALGLGATSVERMVVHRGLHTPRGMQVVPEGAPAPGA